MDDHRYIKKVLEGDHDAFKYLMSDYKDMAYTVAVSILKDEQNAQDAVQNTFIQAFRGLKSFKGNSIFKTWLYRILVNESFRLLKQNNRRNEIELNHENDVSFIYEENNSDQSNQKEAVQQALLKLSTNESLVLNLFYLEDYTLDGICEITGWTTANAKVILHRARKSIKKVLLISKK